MRESEGGQANDLQKERFAAKKFRMNVQKPIEIFTFGVVWKNCGSRVEGQLAQRRVGHYSTPYYNLLHAAKTYYVFAL